MKIYVVDFNNISEVKVFELELGEVILTKDEARALKNILENQFISRDTKDYDDENGPESAVKAIKKLVSI